MTYSTLNSHDVYWCVRRLPKSVFDLMKKHRQLVTLAGGYVRSCIAHEDINDIDLFTSSKDMAGVLAKQLAGDGKPFETDNAFTVKPKPGLPVQFIHRWTFAKPQDVVPSFDFTVALAALWWAGERWESLCDERFYTDLAAKRLVYCSPARNEDAGGSILRVLKFYQRGYRIPLDSLGAVISRLVMGVDEQKLYHKDVPREQMLSKVLTGLLREVDPLIDPNHFAHFESEESVNGELQHA